MKTFYNSEIKLGILGGGQLGRMLIQSAMGWGIKTYILDNDDEAPCKNYCSNFTKGKLTDFDTVYNFGKQMDIITIEIENVNVEALKKLEAEGQKVFPQPSVIETIQDKGLQKLFYKKNKIPTSDFFLIENKKQLIESKLTFPFVQKLRKEGYDGRGVCIINTAKDLAKAFDSPSVIEKKEDVKKEISIIVARNSNGELKCFPAVEMKFHASANLVDYLFCPSTIDSNINKQAIDIATSIAKKLKIVGILAVELFVTKQNKVLVNEIAPRPHNSGHHTIEANVTSQYEQLLRSILNLPLGSTQLLNPCVMINLLGEPDNTGKTEYKNLDKLMKDENVYFHLYGKTITKPFRKMGHATIIDSSISSAVKKAKHIQSILKIISK